MTNDCDKDVVFYAKEALGVFWIINHKLNILKKNYSSFNNLYSNSLIRKFYYNFYFKF